MDYLTLRSLFPRAAVLKLLEEPTFEGCLTLIAQRDVKPASDASLAVFVLRSSLRIRVPRIWNVSSAQILTIRIRIADLDDSGCPELRRARIFVGPPECAALNR